MNKNNQHIQNDQLQAYLDLSLGESKYQEVENHLNSCSTCQEELSRLEVVFIKLANLPEMDLKIDLSTPVIDQLQEESKISHALTWTLVLEVLGAGAVIGLLIPAIKAGSWLPVINNLQTQVQIGINIFLAQLASSWLVWWAELRLNIEHTARSFFSISITPLSEFSPWIMILAAGGIGVLVNYLLLRSNPIRGQKQN